MSAIAVPVAHAEQPPVPQAPPAQTPKAEPATQATASVAKALPRATLSVPLLSPRFADVAIARVDDDDIAMSELTDTLAAAHEKRGEKDGARMAYLPILDRLINVRLAVAEARDMGLDELPEYRQALKDQEARLVIESLKRQAVKDVGPDAKEAEALYRDRVREWKAKSILFAKQEDAKALAAALRAGGDFDALAKAAKADKKGEGADEAIWIGRAEVLPQVQKALDAQPVGKVSDPMQVPLGWIVFRVDEVRYPEDPQMRADAQGASASHQRRLALQKYHLDLVKKYATVDDKLLKALDYDAPKPGFAALKKDQRVLARIKGEKPITVADLSAVIEKKLFHGAEAAARERRMNEFKWNEFEAMLAKRVFTIEAARRKIKDSPDYRRDLAEFERDTLFGMVVDRAVIPGVKITEGPMEDYYKANKKEFTTPEFFKVDAIGFKTVADAQVAFDKTRAGADLGWVRANAAGQLPPDEMAFRFEGKTIAAASMPDSLLKALAGSKAGDVRMAAGPDGTAYILRVIERIAPREQPYVDARPLIAKKMYNETLTRNLEDWFAKLRAAHQVDVYITGVTN